MARVKSALLLATVVASCTPVRGQASATIDFDAVAGAVDPGPQESLLAAMPPWWHDRIDAEPTPEVAQAVGELLGPRWWTLADYPRATRNQGAIGIASALRRLERLTAAELDLSALRALLRAYRELAAPRVTFSPLGKTMLDGCASSWGLDRDRLAELESLDIVLGRRAHRLMGHTSARLLRRGPRGEPLADALRAAARYDLIEHGDPARALRWTAAVVDATAEPRADDWLSLAHACFAALEFERGDAALERAAGAPPRGHPEEPAGLTRARVLATRRAALQARERFADVGRRLERPGREAALARARYLGLLSRIGPSLDAHEALARAYPDDPRPVVGLLGLSTVTGDWAAARQWAERGRGRFEADPGYVGWATVAALTGLEEAAGRGEPAVRAFLADWSARVRQLSALLDRRDGPLGPTLAVAIEHGLFPQGVPDGRSMTRELRELLPAALENRERFPGFAAANQLVFLGALFSDDVDAGLAACREPLHPDARSIPALAWQRATMCAALLYKSGRLARSRVDGALATLDPLLADLERASGESYSGRGLRAVAEALYLGRSPAPRVRMHLERLEQALPPLGVSGRGPVLNLIGMARLRLDDVEGAVNAWQDANQEDHKRSGAAWLNACVAVLFEKFRQRDAEALKAVAENETLDVGVRIEAHGWLAHYHSRFDETEAASDHLRAAARLIAQPKPDAGFPDIASTGVCAAGALKSRLGGTFSDGLHLVIDVDVALWPVLASPFTHAEIEVRAEKR